MINNYMNDKDSKLLAEAFDNVLNKAKQFKKDLKWKMAGWPPPTDHPMYKAQDQANDTEIVKFIQLWDEMGLEDAIEKIDFKKIPTDKVEPFVKYYDALRQLKQLQKHYSV